MKANTPPPPQPRVIPGSLTHIVAQFSNPPLLSVSISGVALDSQRALGFIFDASVPIPTPAQPVNLHSLSTRTPRCLPSAPFLPSRPYLGPTLSSSTLSLPGLLLGSWLPICPFKHPPPPPPLGSEKDICETQICFTASHVSPVSLG